MSNKFISAWNSLSRKRHLEVFRLLILCGTILLQVIFKVKKWITLFRFYCLLLKSPAAASSCKSQYCILVEKFANSFLLNWTNGHSWQFNEKKSRFLITFWTLNQLAFVTIRRLFVGRCMDEKWSFALQAFLHLF